MRLVAHQIQVNGRHDSLVPPTTMWVESGQVAYVASDQDRSTALALALSGRIPLRDGQLDTYDVAPQSIADVSVLVDSPDVSAPLPEQRVVEVVAESLAIARRRSSTAAAREWLSHHSLDGLSDRIVETLDGPERVELLCALAIAHHHVRLLVLDTPDRHRGDVRRWRPMVQRYAESGYAVIVICNPRTVEQLGEPAFTIGATPPLPPPPQPEPEPALDDVDGAGEPTPDSGSGPSDETDQTPGAQS